MTLARAVPNALTIARLVLAIAFPFLPRSAWIPVFLAAVLTEFFDGYLARRWDCATRLGRQLDPVADKLFVLAVAGTLLAAGALTLVELLLLAIRDAAVLLFVAAMLVRGRGAVLGDIEPRLTGKATTALQFVVLVVLLWRGDAPAWLIGVTAAIGLVAAVDYWRSYHPLLTTPAR